MHPSNVKGISIKVEVSKPYSLSPTVPMPFKSKRTIEAVLPIALFTTAKTTGFQLIYDAFTVVSGNSINNRQMKQSGLDRFRSIPI